MLGRLLPLPIAGAAAALRAFAGLSLGFGFGGGDAEAVFHVAGGEAFPAGRSVDVVSRGGDGVGSEGHVLFLPVLRFVVVPYTV